MFWQYLLPQHLLSRLVGAIATCRIIYIKNIFIQWFIRRYRVDMQLAAQSNPLAYPDFNAFFTRALKPGIRPIAAGDNQIISPADGCISQFGRITNGRIFQAKGYDFTVQELLGNKILSSTINNSFINGSFITVYLSPKDYHRVHMPLAGTLKEMIYIPGSLFSVNTQSVGCIPRLFARNERVVTLFDTPYGDMAVILVGAMIVGGIQTTWHGCVAPAPRHRRHVQHWYYKDTPYILSKGDEIGHFKLGSTVIILLASSKIKWHSTIMPNNAMVMGQSMAEIYMDNQAN